jgi:hypothetical protein
MSSATRAATSCIQEPMFDTSAAIQMLRNTDVTRPAGSSFELRSTSPIRIEDVDACAQTPPTLEAWCCGATQTAYRARSDSSWARATAFLTWTAWLRLWSRK